MRGPNAVQQEFLLVLWACYLSGCARSFAHKDFVFPPEGKSAISYILESHPGLIFVHGTFTVSAILTTWWILSRFPGELVPEKA